MLSTNRRTLIVITGPTAVGKTAVSIAVAKRFNAEIVSADARQFYREMNIGTAKPSIQQLAAVYHHFIGHLSIQDDYSAGKYEHDAIELLSRLFTTNDTIVLTGGSGLFIRSVLVGLDSFPPVDRNVRRQLMEMYTDQGIEILRSLLLEHDPAYYKTVDLNNPSRLIRALTVSLSSGKPYSFFRREKPKVRNFNPLLIGLTISRELLYRRIDERVDRMMAGGLIREAKELFNHRHLTALQTVGYSELFKYLEQKMTLAATVDLIKRNTRNYAKRQMTWFNKMKDINWFHPDNLPGIFELIENRDMARPTESE